MKYILINPTFKNQSVEITNPEAIEQIKGQDTKFGYFNTLKIDDEFAIGINGQLYKLRVANRVKDELFLSNINR